MQFPWLRSKDSRRSARPVQGRRRPSFKPSLESLEERALLAAGALDPTFGTGGLVATTLNYNASDSNSTGFKSLAVQVDGKYLIADVSNGAVPGFNVARFNTNGTLDPTFGTNGIANVHFAAGSTDVATAVALQADGKVIVVGTTTDSGGNSNFGVARFTTTGQLDKSFGFNQNGTAFVDFTPAPPVPANTLPHWQSTASSLTIEPDGRIVIAGNVLITPNGPSGVPVQDVAVARLNADGTQDADFDADGRVIANIGATLSKGQFESTDAFTDVGIEPDGKIVAVGWTNIEQDGKLIDQADNFAIARFNPDGTLDKNFSGGLLSYDLSTSPYGLTGPSPFKDRAYSVAFQLDGKILISGSSQYQVAGPGGNPPNALSQDNFATIRLNTNGQFDNTFTADGVVITDFANDFALGSEDQANQITVQADGKILVSGFTTTSSTNPGPAPAPNPNNKNFALARYNTDGTLDQTFGFHGKVINDVGFGATDYANQSAVLTNGKFFTVGAIGDNPNAKLVLAQYIGFTPGTIQFSQANYNVSENGGSVTITVTRVGGTDGTATVQYATTANTAVAGTDFAPVTGTLTFAPGVTSQSFTVNVRDDGVFQTSNKVFNVTLTNLAGGPGFGTPSTATVTLVEADQPGGNINPGGGPVVQTATDKFINQVYLDLLGRPVDATSLKNWENYLNSGGTRAGFVALVTQSQEYHNVVVNTLFVHYLHRNADPNGLASFSAVLASGGTDEQVAASLAGSAEYFQNRGGGTNSGFLNAIYSDVLNRAPDSAGFNHYSQLLAGGATTGQVAGSLLTSTEYDTGLVTGFYQKFLRRAPDSAGLTTDVNLLQNGTSPTAQSIFPSDPSGAHRVTDEYIIILMMSSLEYYTFATR